MVGERKKVIKISGVLDDSRRVAACIAAVIEYENQEAGRRADADGVSGGRMSAPWGRASLIEGVGERVVRGSVGQKGRSRLWNTLACFLVCLAVTCSAPALATAELDTGGPLPDAAAGPSDNDHSQTASTFAQYPEDSARLDFEAADCGSTGPAENQDGAFGTGYGDTGNKSEAHGEPVNAKASGAQPERTRLSDASGPGREGDVAGQTAVSPSDPSSGFTGHTGRIEDSRESGQEAELSPLPARLDRKQRLSVRVILKAGASSIRVDCLDGARVRDLVTGKLVADLKPTSRWKIAPVATRHGRKIAFYPVRRADRYLITTGAALEPVKKVAYYPRALPSVVPPMIPTHVRSTRRQSRHRRYRAAALVVPTRSGTVSQSLTGELALGDSATTVGARGGYVVTPSVGNGNNQPVFSVGDRAYRGSLIISVDGYGRRARLTAVNVVDLEDYLLSVLPAEMPHGWPQEALKAQAIASRSYVVATLARTAAKPYDVTGTVANQVYKGIGWEKSSTTRAVMETAGIVLRHGGKVAEAFFHSSGGGFTELSQHVWTRETPYLKSVRDPDHSSPHYRWDRQFSSSQLKSAFGGGVGEITGIFPVHRSPSNRVKSLLVVGMKGAKLVDGRSVRRLLKLPGTNFNIDNLPAAYKFSGQGFGHGLGMSQWGARALADQGYNAAQILKYYYKDVTFGYVFDTVDL